MHPQLNKNNRRNEDTTLLILDNLLDTREYLDNQAPAGTALPPNSSSIADPPGNYDATTNNSKKSSLGIINSPGGLSQMVTPTHDWAQQHYQDICTSDWKPWDIDMEADINLWKKSNSLTEGERILIIRSMGLFSAANSLMANNPLQAIYRHILSTTCRKYLLHQAFKETLHIRACQHMAISLNISSDDILSAYREMPAIADKAKWARPLIHNLLDPHFQSGSVTNNQRLLKELVAFYVVFKGIFLYTSLTQVISLAQYNKMVGIGRQFQHILRDMTKHISFGIDVINQIKIENPYLWTPEVKNELMTMIGDAVNLEIKQVCSTMPWGIPVLDIDTTASEDNLKLTVNRHCAQLGLSEQYI